MRRTAHVSARAGWIVNAGADFRPNDVLQERPEQAHLRACQQRANRRDESLPDFGVPKRQQKGRQRVAELLDGGVAQRAQHLHRVDRHVDGRGEQLLLGAVVVVHQCRVNPGRRGYRADRRFVNSILREEFPGTRQDPLTGVRSARRPPGPSAFGFCRHLMGSVAVVSPPPGKAR